MAGDRRDDGFRELMLRIRRGGDETAWDELLSRVLPQLWRAAIEAIGDGDPQAVGLLVGGTLLEIAARLDEFQLADDDPGTYAAFCQWWRTLMLALRPSRAAASVAQPLGWKSGSAPCSVPGPSVQQERDCSLPTLRPRLWRAAIHMMGDEEPHRVALLVEATAASILAHLAEAPATNDDQATAAFDLWWHGLMIHAAAEMLRKPGNDAAAENS
jgi:hypothetical protein